MSRMCFPFQTCNTKKNIVHNIPWAIFPFCWSRCAWVYRHPSAACSVALILNGNYSFHLHSAFNTGRWTTHFCVSTLCLVHYGYLNKIFLWISEFIREIFVNCLIEIPTSIIFTISRKESFLDTFMVLHVIINCTEHIDTFSNKNENPKRWITYMSAIMN